MLTAIAYPSSGVVSQEPGAYLLGRPRRHLAEIAGLEARPRRVLQIGGPDFDAAPWFPDAIVRRGHLPDVSGERPNWAGWPDLVWVDHALGGADPAGVVASLCRHLAPDTYVAVVGVHDATRAQVRQWLTAELAVVADRRVRAALCRLLVPRQWSLLGVDGLWLALVFLGRVPAPLPLRRDGPLCEEMDEAEAQFYG